MMAVTALAVPLSMVIVFWWVFTKAELDSTALQLTTPLLSEE